MPTLSDHRSQFKLTGYSYVRDFEVVDINSIYTKMRNNEIFYLYVGRITCLSV